MKKLAFIVALLCALPAHADMMRYGVSSAPTGAAGYVGPGNFQSFTSWYGLRAYSSSHCTGAVNAARLVRASDSTTQIITINTACNLDTPTAVTFCAATTCVVDILYDQVSQTACGGASCNLVQTTAANRPAFVFNCIGAFPCIRSSATDLLRSVNNTTPATGVVSLTMTTAKTGAACNTLRQNAVGNRLTMTTAGQPNIAGGTSGSISGAAIADGAFVSSVGVINGASSFVRSGSDIATGTAVGNTTAGLTDAVVIGTATTCTGLTLGIADNVALTNTQAASIIINERGYWGF